jgi:adenine C2-methylase RlmN of 23S rRNA A2503 and tRNA A37
MPKFNVSTIFPTDYNPAQLLDNFSGLPITFYYSLYSLKPEFRRRWLPRALRPDVVLDVLADWQNVTGREVVLHWAFIEGENDSKRDIDDIVSAIDSRGLKVRMNIVRYNPFSAGQGREASEERINEIYGQISRRLSLPGSRIVPRVGFSVKASCGMFVQAVG